MNEDYVHLTLVTVQQALDELGLEYWVTGMGSFGFVAEGRVYNLYCSRLPRVFIEKETTPPSLPGSMPEFIKLFALLDSVNEKYSLVKTYVGEEGELWFTLGTNENRYEDFRDNFMGYVRELDDAMEAFRLAVEYLKEEETDGSMKALLDRMMDADDEMYKKKRTRS
jgi:hypothetical protein